MSRFGHASFARDPLRHSISSTSDTSPSSVLDSASVCYGNSPGETWSDSSSSSPEAMMPYQQPWAIEPAMNYSIISPSTPLPDGLPRIIPGGNSPEWSSPVMPSNYSPTRPLRPETRRLPAGKALYKSSLPAAALPPHLQSSSSSTNPTTTTSLSPTSATMPYHSLPLSMVSPPVKVETDREDIAMDEAEDTNADPPYSQLIYEALFTAPGKKLPLQGIYLWFEKNTAKGRDRGSKGWQNSIRHNLSMNAGFEAVREETTPGKKAVNYWRLTEEAITNGIQSTTRYRKQANYKKSVAADPPAPQRQRSGAKGGKATKITARFRSGQSINSMASMSQEEYLRERGCRQHQPFPKPNHPYHQAQRVIPSQRQHHHLLPPTKNFLYGQYFHRPSTIPTTATGLPQGGGGGTTLPLTRSPVEGFDLGNIVGCTDAPPCTAPTPIFCDMAGPGPDCLVFDTGFMAWDGMHPSFANSEISTSDLHVGL
ncbi:hypothetical protein BJY00DRAFT_313506 [Aspergillus carlsbadensis]|nr:hypothetical protein BJY00DRAFT_313506 [Aspergillus carlsbadensis]